MSAVQCKNSYITNNLIGFSLVGVIIKLFFNSNTTADGSSGPANASIWGYGVIIGTIFTAIFLSFALLSVGYYTRFQRHHNASLAFAERNRVLITSFTSFYG